MPKSKYEEFFSQAFKTIINKLKPAEYKLLFDLLRKNINSIANFLMNVPELIIFITPLKRIGEEDGELLTLILIEFEEQFSKLEINQIVEKITLLTELKHNPNVILSKLGKILLSCQPGENESHYAEILTLVLQFPDFKLTLTEFQTFLTTYLMPGLENQNFHLPLLKESKIRSLGFNFVYVQCNSDESKIPILLETLNKLVLNKTWRRSKENYWKIKPNSFSSDFEYKGLDNPGTICYSNSFIQQLFYMPTFIDPLLSLYSKEKNCLSALQKVFVKLKFSCMPSVSSNSLIKSCVGPKGLHQQMDTDEFIFKLFEKCSKTENGFKFDEIIQKNFLGIQNLEIKCKRCQRVFNKTQDFKNIGLQIFKKEKNSLLNSLRKMTCGEMMSGDNALFCSTCKRKETCETKISFIELPLYLIFVVKRFEYDTRNMARIKVDEVFEFTEKVNLMEFVRCKTSECIRENFEYQLKGVINHVGTADEGHYISCIRTLKDEWVEFNDSKVSKTSLNKVLKDSFGRPNGDFYTLSSYIIIYKSFENSSKPNINKFNLTPCEKYFFPKITEKNREFKFREILFAERFLNSVLKFLSFNEFHTFIVNYTLSCFFRMNLEIPEKMMYYKEIYEKLSLDASIYLIEILSSPQGVKEFIICNPYSEHKTFLITILEKQIPLMDKSFLIVIFKRLLKIYASFSTSHYKFEVHLSQLFFIVINNLQEEWKNRYINYYHIDVLNYRSMNLKFEIENYKTEFFWTEDIKIEQEVKDHYRAKQLCPCMFLKFMFENFNKIGNKIINLIKNADFINSVILTLRTKLGLIVISQLYSEVFKNDTKGALEYLGIIIALYTKSPYENDLKLVSAFFNHYPARTELFLNFIEFYLDLFLATHNNESHLFIKYTIKSLRKLNYNELAFIISEETQEKLKNAIEIYLCQEEDVELRIISQNFFAGVENKDLNEDDEIDPKNLAKKKLLWVSDHKTIQQFEIVDNFCNKILSFGKMGQSVFMLDYVHFDRIRFIK